jgi:hypothetical protein
MAEAEQHERWLPGAIRSLNSNGLTTYAIGTAA